MLFSANITFEGEVTSGFQGQVTRMLIICCRFAEMFKKCKLYIYFYLREISVLLFQSYLPSGVTGCPGFFRNESKTCMIHCNTLFHQKYNRKNIRNTHQCSKLRVHPAPCVHILVAGCIGFRTCAPSRCMLFSNFHYDHIEMNPWTYSD